MSSLARWCVRHRFSVILLWIALFVGLTSASGSLGTNFRDTFNLPGTESTKALGLLVQGFGQTEKGDQDSIVFHAINGTSLGDPATQAAITKTLAEIRTLPSVALVVSPFTKEGAAQISQKDPSIAYATVIFTGSAFTLKHEDIRTVVDKASTLRRSSLEVEFGGRAISQLNQPKGNPGELFGVLAAGIILILAFGSFLAMLLPLGTAIFALGTASAAVGLLTHTFSIATFAPQLASLIGLGVGIDYALFIVTRYRQSLLKGMSVEESVVTAVNTSGRAVLFAGATVCIALLGMLVLRLSFLNGVAIAASVTVLITMFAAITLLPALLRVMGMRALSRGSRRQLAQEGGSQESQHPRWDQWSAFVAKRPLPLAIAAIAVISVLIVPYFSLHLGNADQSTDPQTSTTYKAYSLLSKGFGAGFNGPLQIVAPITNASDLETMSKLAAGIKQNPNVAHVAPVQVSEDHKVALLMVFQKSGPSDIATSDLIKSLRTTTVPEFTQGTTLHAYVGGATAIFDDFARTLSDKLPLFIGVIVLLGCLLLLIAFRSLLIPATAALMNLLAAGASFGVVVAVFQWGWGGSLLNVGSGPIESFLPVIMIAILFGLSMDYQVFLVSRMHEEWVHTGDNKHSVLRGQADTGRVITAAALIMISVFVAFVFGGERVIAEFGIGLGAAVFLDAFILRTILVPAMMHLFGNANWWLPSWLDKKMPHLAVEAPDEAN